MGQVALTPNPATPAIPQPVADLGALAMVSQALKQRVENVSAYVLGLTTAEASTTSDTAAVSSYTLPIASINVLGGVKVDGDNTTVVDGVLQVAGARPATVLPLRDGIAAVGAATSYARADHVHPTDTSRYAASNPAGFATQDYVDSALAMIRAGLVTFVHTQATPAAVWLITHNLNRFPSVEIVDSAGAVVEGDIVFNNRNTITVSFVAAFAGLAYLN